MHVPSPYPLNDLNVTRNLTINREHFNDSRNHFYHKGSESHHLFENTVWVKFVIAYQEMDAAAGYNMYSTYVTMHDASQQSNICKYGFPWFRP